MERKIKLNQYSNVDAGKMNTSININMSNDKNIIRENEFNEGINLYSTYLDEREACTKIRLTSQINLIANNSVFNYVTEVVKNEESLSAVCLNFTPKQVASTFGKDETYQWGSEQKELTRDTQITASNYTDKDYKYLCGIDIFNNHVLRSLNSTPVYYKKGVSTKYFNTISDLLVDENGAKPKSAAYNFIDITDKDFSIDFTNMGLYIDDTYMHLYRRNTILSFMDCINQRMQTKGGWYGFINRSKMSSYSDSGVDFGVSKVLNNVQVNSFVDLYPGRNHYSLLPHYNKARHRQEKNWEYCLTYPFSATTEGIPTINQDLGTLKISHIDENQIDYDDLRKTVIYSLGKHGLQQNDIINIYRSNLEETQSELVESNIIVDSIIDEYTFVVYLGDYICHDWVSVYDESAVTEYFSSHQKGSDKYYYNNDTDFVRAFNEFINADFDHDSHIGSQNLSFCRVVKDEECKYYARIFSRFPNFDFYQGEINERTIYSKSGGNKRVIDEYSNIIYEKQSTLTKLGFSKNIYGDDIAQIVYTDDIDINHIKDNLGRPLTSLYLSFFKTNYGRKQWYNKNVTNENVEFSHCFGKLNCGIKMSRMADTEIHHRGNINVMNNIDTGYGGLSLLPLRGEFPDFDDDEISYVNQTYFYGDICEYSDVDCMERVLQPIMHRFNTQQRELRNSGLLAESDSFSSVVYNEIERDDYDAQGFSVNEQVFDASPTAKREGYYYISNYEIPIRSFSDEISEFIPLNYRLADFKFKDGVYTAVTLNENYFDMDSDVHLYDMKNGLSYNCNIVNILASNVVSFTLTTEDGEPASLSLTNINLDNYRIYKRSVVIPSYARVSADGSGKYRWRKLIQNGFESIEGEIPEYPFTNGVLYINKPINLFLRRQDPFNMFGIADNNGIEALIGVSSDAEDSGDDSVINESESIC